MQAIKKKNYSKWRAISLLSVYVLMGIHIAHWKIAGRTLAPLELNEVLYTLHLGIITAGFIFMAVTLVATIVAGRFFCSWMCHILALQDGSVWLLNKLGIRPKHIRSRTLLVIPLFSVAYLFILPQIEKIYLGQPMVQFKTAGDADGWASFITTDLWRNLPGIGITALTFIFCGGILIYLLGSRSFCQYACPYGVLFGLADRVAPGRIKLTGDCTNCGICTSVCQSHVQVHKEVGQFKMVVNSDCLKDLDCIQVCPENALSYGLAKPAGFKSLSKLTHKRKYDFTLTEDVVMILFFLFYLVTFRGLYDTIPFLLALGISITLSWLTVLASRLFRTDFVRLNNIILRRSGQLTSHGKTAVVLFGVMILFSLHSAFIHYHAYLGEKQYEAFLHDQHDKVYSPSALSTERLQSVWHHSSIANDWGLMVPASLNRQLAAIAIYMDNKEEAAHHLEKLLEKLPGDIEARLRYAKFLFVLKEENKAARNLQKIVESENLFTERDKKIRSDALTILGHMEERNGFSSSAENRYRAALNDNASNQEATLALGVLLVKAGKLQESETLLLSAAAANGTSPLIDNNLAVIYMREHKYSEAIIHLDALLQKQPGNTQAIYNKAMMKYAMGEKQVAVEMLTSITHEHPDFQNAYAALTMMNKQVYPAGENKFKSAQKID